MFISRESLSQHLFQGGMQKDVLTILLPGSGPIRPSPSSTDRSVAFLGFKRDGGTLVIAPTHPPTWNWFAVANLEVDGTPMNFFFYDGQLYTTEDLKTNKRRRKFDEDVTRRIYSNVFHIAFRRKKVVEDETVLLLVSPRKQLVQVKLDKSLFGHERVLEYSMEANEAKFIYLIATPEEYTVVTWKPVPDQRETIPLANTWWFHKGDVPGAEKIRFRAGAAWKEVSIPHSWNTDDVYDSRPEFDRLNIMEMYYRGKGWYRTSFAMPNTGADRVVKLSFLGANQVAEVWLNEKYLGKHIGGYTGFEFDVSAVIRRGAQNVLAVKVDNSYNYDIPPHSGDFNIYGGLYREVNIEVLPSTHIADVWVRTPTVSHKEATAHIKTVLKNVSSRDRRIRLVTNIISPYREIIQSLIHEAALKPHSEMVVEQQTSPVRNPLLWSPDHPYLYSVSSLLYGEKGHVLERREEPLGFRWFQFDADSGFFLNGKSLKLKGVNFHQDYLFKGNAVSVEQKRQDVQYIKEIGANFVRLAHYPHHPATLAFLDSMGLLAWAEIPFINTVGGEEFFTNAKSMLREMIYRDKNHPSIILWGLGNEFQMEPTVEQDIENGRKLVKELHALAKTLDPTRLTTQAHDGMADYSVLSETDVQGRNRYYGWYKGTYNDLGRELDADHRNYPHWKILVSEYGAEGKYGHHVNDPKLFDHSETYQLAFHEASWNAIASRPFVAGGTVWNMFDFGSHFKIGNIPHINQKGMMTKDRRPKSVYYYYQSQWSTKPMVYIVSHTWTHREGAAGEPQEVRVFSNCDDVELFLNGKSMGTHTSRFRWRVPLQAGENNMLAIGRLNGEIVKHEITVVYSETLPAREQ
jgi:beta-galactosidase